MFRDIKFGTDGWRALIGKEYTVGNVIRVSLGVVQWMKEKKFSSVIIGHDCRFGGKMFAEAAASVFAQNGIQVVMDRSYVTTPMISLALVKLNVPVGVIITASHNPPEYNGYKLKSGYGGPTAEEDIRKVESFIPENIPEYTTEINGFIQNGAVKFLDLSSIYQNHLESHFNLEKLRSISSSMVYDSMFGAGREIMQSNFPLATHLHNGFNPYFDGIAPEPIPKNLKTLESFIKEHKGMYSFGLANDGDADRIGMYDGNGCYVDAQHILLLLLYYLVEFKKFSGRVVVSFAVTEKVKLLAKTYGLPYTYTKIGFKNITPLMLKEQVIMAGEEAGGIAAINHIPERDGIWIGLMMMELMVKTGKNLAELVDLIHEKVGRFTYDRVDLHLSLSQKEKVVLKCIRGEIVQIGHREIVKTYDLDGYKYYFGDDEWLMIRPSGTEPVLRLYAQSKSERDVKQLLADAQKELLAEN
ncbi:MAG TPA: phosphoglucosamine mutase [Saprospirales bacterium]|nr:phosphoglucosamine mutase [Saprospirales bacterium]